MLALAVILDRRPTFMGVAGELESLLTLPVGKGVLLERMARAADALRPRSLAILPLFETDPSYQQGFHRLGLNPDIISQRELNARLHRLEPSDNCVIVDSRYWPSSGFDLRRLEERREDGRWSVHAVCVSTEAGQTQEHVRCDARGRVWRVRRYYRGVTWPRTGPVLASLMPVSAAENLAFGELRDVRSLLTMRGMLSQDVDISQSFFDLNRPEALRGFLESSVREATEGLPKPREGQRQDRVWIAPSARVAADARLIGPVVVQKDCVVEDGAMIIGPTLLGAGCRVGAHAVVAQAMVAAGAFIPAHAECRQVLVTNEGARPGAAGPSANGVAEPPANRDSHESDLLSNGRPSGGTSNGVAAAASTLKAREGMIGNGRAESRSAANAVESGQSPAARMTEDEDRLAQRLRACLQPVPRFQSLSPGSMIDPVAESGLYIGIKRWIEGALALTALVVLSPILLPLALWIKLDSSGPVFFLDVREGRGGRVFRCIKFRTMHEDADRRQRELYESNDVDGPQFKLKDDPRVTRAGRWLRQTNLDEVPQLINVVLGQMSLVGPRPSPFRENQICVPWRRTRLSVRPGITGLWQICRHDREQGDFHQWIAYDIAYVRNLSFWLDLRILLATVLTLGGRWSVPESWIVRHSSRLS